MVKIIPILLMLTSCAALPMSMTMSASSRSAPVAREPYATVSDIGEALFEYTERDRNGRPSAEVVPGRTHYLITVHMPERSSRTHVYVSSRSLTRAIWLWPGETLGYERVMKPNGDLDVEVELLFYDTASAYRFGSREDAFARLYLIWHPDHAWRSEVPLNDRPGAR